MEAFHRSARRIAGLPNDIAAEIQALQPYHGGYDARRHSLWVLSELTNINKHRRILLTSLRWDFASINNKAGEAVRRVDAEVVPEFAGQMDVDDEFVAYIAFDEGVAKHAEVSNVLNTIAKTINDIVLPRFERFF